MNHLDYFWQIYKYTVSNDSWTWICYYLLLSVRFVVTVNLFKFVGNVSSAVGYLSLRADSEFYFWIKIERFAAHKQNIFKWNKKRTGSASINQQTRLNICVIWPKKHWLAKSVWEQLGHWIIYSDFYASDVFTVTDFQNFVLMRMECD